jgi:hypothetical protein
MNPAHSIPGVLRHWLAALLVSCLVGNAISANAMAEAPIVRDLPPGLQVPDDARIGPSITCVNISTA